MAEALGNWKYISMEDAQGPYIQMATEEIEMEAEPQTPEGSDWQLQIITKLNQQRHNIQASTKVVIFISKNDEQIVLQVQQAIDKDTGILKNWEEALQG